MDPNVDLDVENVRNVFVFVGERMGLGRLLELEVV
jgi:hypothetical protein